MPKVHLTYIVTAHRKPRSKYGLGNDFGKWATEAGLPRCCRMHGLKKGGMRRLAEAGGTAHELMAFSGHKTDLRPNPETSNNIIQKRLAFAHERSGTVAGPSRPDAISRAPRLD
jgi:hypothetical protein